MAFACHEAYENWQICSNDRHWSRDRKIDDFFRELRSYLSLKHKYKDSVLKERGGGQNFSTSFWMWFSQAPLCRYRFKFIFDDIIFLLSGNIIEYICFWRFNSIIMTWNKWLVFTKSVIMGLNNISPWPCPLGFVCLPCVITWLFSTLGSSCDPLV